MSGLKVGVVSFPGSNCDEDAVLAIVEQLHERAVRLWHKDHDLQGARRHHPPGRLQLWRLPARRRHRPLLAHHA
jgi:phosphoribosylformylglycinamidine (FGAM) synthase-like amidotransferase family enzyme